MPEIDPTTQEEKNKYSLEQIAPPSFRKAMALIPDEWQHLNEAELKEVCYPTSTVTEKCASERRYLTDAKLRAAFWVEYEAAIKENRVMHGRNIHTGILNETTFYVGVMRDIKRVAWIMHPPGNYVAELNAHLTAAISRYEDVLKIPIFEKICRCWYRCVCKSRSFIAEHESCLCQPNCKCPTTTNTKAADIILKAIEQIELRVKGSIPVIQKNLNVNYNKDANQNNIPHPDTQQEMEKRLQELMELRQKYIGGAKTLAQVLDTETKPTEKEVIEVEIVDNKETKQP